MKVPRKRASGPEGFRYVLATIVAPALVQACFCVSWVPFVRAMIAIVVIVLLVIAIQHWVLLLPV